MGRKRSSIYTRAGFKHPRRGPFRVADQHPDAPKPLACEVDQRIAQIIENERRRLGLA